MEQETNEDIFAKTSPSAVAPGKWAQVYHNSVKIILTASRDSAGGQGEWGKWEIPGCQGLPWLAQGTLLEV